MSIYFKFINIFFPSYYHYQVTSYTAYTVLRLHLILEISQQAEFHN